MSFENEELITLSEASQRIPVNINKSTLWRWCRKGLNGVMLEYLRVGKRIYTTEDALERFNQSLEDEENA